MERATSTSGGSAAPGPVFIAGPDRSGTTLMYALLASHPDISMVRRTNIWRYFHRRYGDLAVPANFDRCLNDMVRYRRMRHLQPDRERIRNEFLQGAPTYGRLFALFHEHNAERAGKAHWGDKSLHTEHYADRVFAEFPDARIIHMVRDPRDRYASVRRRHGRDISRVSAATARWLDSTRAGRHNAERFPDRYLMVRYEDLAREPEATMRGVSDFIGIAYSAVMLSMEGAPDLRDAGGNSSFGDIEPGSISTRGIGRFRSVLTPSEIAFIELAAGRDMTAVGYERAGVPFAPRARVRFYAWELPVSSVRMARGLTVARIYRLRGERIQAFRIEGDPPTRPTDARSDSAPSET